MASTVGTPLYDRLRTAILSLDYVPGEKLTERGLESDLDASRTPIRTALLRLEADGLVRREGRGWSVTPIDLTEIRALSEYREAVEAACARLAAARASDSDLAALADSLNETGNADTWSGDPTSAHATDLAISEAGIRAGNDFHALLAQLSGNPFMADSIRGVMTRLLRTRWLEVRTPESRAHAREEHLAIVAALQRRDADAAAALVVAHTRGTAERTLAFLSDERRRLRGRGFAIIESEPARAHLDAV
ncbi:GntR family transcriptional regulator [Agromyces fucosus]|uniref:GntR family transcriptional regulator n=1 Tax=Agromyces fucosus TaxID=41985 RepID=A0A4Q2JHR7_9MICO|nr:MULTISPECIES: GntR family transcriptional regulator [Agromyces]KQZ09574.1 GntR family transcriptional regulator [Agromyces sp. Root1464]RXZ47272.1 GntR family transcriptional regulator [Agromyces fucosus]